MADQHLGDSNHWDGIVEHSAAIGLRVPRPAAALGSYR
jgi:hypothetical protein